GSGCLDGGGGAGVSAGVAGAGAVRAHVGLGETGKERFGVVDVSGVGIGVGRFLYGLSCFGGGLGLPPGDVREAGDVAVAGTAAGRAVVPGALRGHAVVERGGGVGDVVDLLDGAVPAVELSLLEDARVTVLVGTGGAGMAAELALLHGGDEGDDLPLVAEPQLFTDLSDDSRIAERVSAVTGHLLGQTVNIDGDGRASREACGRTAWFVDHGRSDDGDPEKHEPAGAHHENLLHGLVTPARWGRGAGRAGRRRAHEG